MRWSNLNIEIENFEQTLFVCLSIKRGRRVVRRCWVKFQRRGILLIWINVGQGPIALAVDAGGGSLDIFPSSIISLLLSPSLWGTTRYRLK